MVSNATFNSISATSWRSVLSENHWPVANHWYTLSHNVVSSTPRHELPILVVIIHVVLIPTTVQSRSRRPPFERPFCKLSIYYIEISAYAPIHLFRRLNIHKILAKNKFITTNYQINPTFQLFMDFIILHLLLWITIIITLNHCFMADGVTIN